jgi:hypothetical protein
MRPSTLRSRPRPALRALQQRPQQHHQWPKPHAPERQQQQRRRPIDDDPPGEKASAAAAAAAQTTPSATFPLLVLGLLSAPPPNALAKTVCFEVPDWAADLPGLSSSPSGGLASWVMAHPPVALAAGSALLALLPRVFRLARTSLKYAALALVLWIAVSHPRESAAAVEAALGFARDHPVAASSAAVVAVAVVLGPETLATAGSVGILLLLASAAGVIELPSAPPKFPGLPSLPGSLVERVERAVGGRGGGVGGGGGG